MAMLSNGDTFPTLTIDAVGGGTISLPDDLAGSFGVILIYRGSWCPYRNASWQASHGLRTPWPNLASRRSP